LVGEAGFEPATPWPPAKYQPCLVIPNLPRGTPAVLDPESSALRPSLPLPRRPRESAIPFAIPLSNPEDLLVGPGRESKVRFYSATSWWVASRGLTPLLTPTRNVHSVGFAFLTQPGWDLPAAPRVGPHVCLRFQVVETARGEAQRVRWWAGRAQVDRRRVALVGGTCRSPAPRDWGARGEHALGQLLHDRLDP